MGASSRSTSGRGALVTSLGDCAAPVEARCAVSEGGDWRVPAL